MPQLDSFTYFTQFFWSSLLICAFYIPISHSGVLGISRLIKLRNPLLDQPVNDLRRRPEASRTSGRALADLRDGVAALCVKYLSDRVGAVHKWCQPSTVFWSELNNWGVLSCIGELTGSMGMDLTIDSLSTPTFERERDGVALCQLANLSVPHGQCIVAS